jgi:hypothetical protein
MDGLGEDARMGGSEDGKMGAAANSFAERSCGLIRALGGARNDGPENTPENWLGGSAGSFSLAINGLCWYGIRINRQRSSNELQAVVCRVIAESRAICAQSQVAIMLTRKLRARFMDNSAGQSFLRAGEAHRAWKLRMAERKLLLPPVVANGCAVTDVESAGAAMDGAEVSESDAGASGDLGKGKPLGAKRPDPNHASLAFLFWRHAANHSADGGPLAVLPPDIQAPDQSHSGNKTGR